MIRWILLYAASLEHPTRRATSAIRKPLRNRSLSNCACLGGSVRRISSILPSFSLDSLSSANSRGSDRQIPSALVASANRLCRKSRSLALSPLIAGQGVRYGAGEIRLEVVRSGFPCQFRKNFLRQVIRILFAGHPADKPSPDLNGTSISCTPRTDKSTEE